MIGSMMGEKYMKLTLRNGTKNRVTENEVWLKLVDEWCWLVINSLDIKTCQK